MQPANDGVFQCPWARRVRDLFLAGWSAVQPERCLPNAMDLNDDLWRCGTQVWSRESVRHLCVVGGGKVSGLMASTLARMWAATRWREVPQIGWVNVPEGTEPGIGNILHHPVRPWGENAPTEAAVAGTVQMVRLMRTQPPGTLFVVILSGGGSAMLCWPKPPLTWYDKRTVTRQLSAAGADIGQLNALRSRLSLIKRGGMLAAVPETALGVQTLILSDVLGDPLDVIASGPTWPVEEQQTLHAEPAEILKSLGLRMEDFSPAVRACWRDSLGTSTPSSVPRHYCIVGNLARAVGAAAEMSRRVGEVCATEIQDPNQREDAETLGRKWAQRCWESWQRGGRNSFVSGGEPTVKLTARPGRGGRNQQLVLGFIDEALKTWPPEFPAGDFAFLSGGTDGEDGNTTVAGAVVNRELIITLRRERIDPAPYLAANDAFSFFKSRGCLWEVPRGLTNVGDLRILVTSSPASGLIDDFSPP